jgi:dihydrofolate reductase
MAELTMTAFLSLDGVMQAPGGPEEDTSGNFPYGGWLVPHADEDMGQVIDEIFAKVDAFLLGRVTYDIFAAHWPKFPDPNDPVASKLNSLPKFVASRSKTSFEWNGTSHIGDVVKEVPDLKKQFSGEIQVHGSCGLAQTLINHNLIDEYRFLIFPVVLGTGKRLFDNVEVPSTLQLISFSTTSKGAIFCVYRPVGALKTSSFALE